MARRLWIAALLTAYAAPSEARACDAATVAAARLHAMTDARALGGALGNFEVIPAGAMCATLYMVEGPHGGNSWIQRLAIVDSRDPSNPVSVVTAGARGELDVGDARWRSDGVLQITVQIWLPGDAECCPSSELVNVTCRPLAPNDCALPQLLRRARRLRNRHPRSRTP